jgi:hypothetical protein
MSITKLNNLSVSALTALPSGVGGKVLQVVSTTKTDTFTTTSASFTDLTGMSVSITPSSASNKILILAKVSVGADFGINRAGVKLLRSSTGIFIGDTSSSRTPASSAVFSANDDDIEDVNIIFLDSPSTTSSTTYKIQITTTGSGTICVNRSFSDTDNTAGYRPASTITVMEIAP